MSSNVSTKNLGDHLFTTLDISFELGNLVILQGGIGGFSDDVENSERTKIIGMITFWWFILWKDGM
jgi:molybdopterin-biosynthesis enzyme MoeA-like protein